MSAVIETRVARHKTLTAWLPLVVFPLATAWFAAEWPPWVFMWSLSVSIYVGLKWLSFADAFDAAATSTGRSICYLLLWSGMDARSFLADSQLVELPRWSEGLPAVAKVIFGTLLVALAVRTVDQLGMIAGWIGMVGIVFTLHFGLFHLLSVAWRRVGVDAVPIMDAPIRSSSLSEFWGKRWNLAFRDLAHTYVFRPFAGRLGIAGATMAVFVVSGLVHDAVISISAGGGYGLPTLYFVIQGLGVLFERSRLGMRFGTRKGMTGRLFCAAVTLGPVVLLFHRPFVEEIVIPMLAAIGSLGG